ncbi:hypothetical protein PDO_5011 [Rhizobium sp. PDO1-076]|uniref:hypothetical protein n=1 Tax=Rhizobium sp. PDO1-076 TaxID=1125979 RepID=UPI00024E25A5|nr:hypothetical protein [Rhizobium sp. PDO1-076]EHS51855.1 hypothetical protein PDO_5011 [Rhizobium sp. PDO1-076]
MSRPSAPLNRDTAAQIARMAECVIRPLEFVHDDYLSHSPLDGQAFKKLAAFPAFCTPLNQAFSRNLGLKQLSFSKDFLRELDENVALKITLRLLQYETAEIVTLARHCAAIQLFPQIRLCVLKSKRKKAETILGSDAFLTAMREAQAFYPCLAERSRAFQLDEVLRPNSDQEGYENPDRETSHGAAQNAHPTIWEGLKTFIAFARRADPGCATLFSLRFQNPMTTAGLTSTAPTLTDMQAAELTTFFRNRGVPW